MGRSGERAFVGAFEGEVGNGVDLVDRVDLLDVEFDDVVGQEAEGEEAGDYADDEGEVEAVRPRLAGGADKGVTGSAETVGPA